MSELRKLDVSRETFEKLEAFGELVRKWNPRINLVSKSSLDDLWTRHILDSVQVFNLAEGSGVWVDLGSGGGFPELSFRSLTKRNDISTLLWWRVTSGNAHSYGLPFESWR